MKRIKKILAGVLAAVMLSTAFSSFAFAADGNARRILAKAGVLLVERAEAKIQKYDEKAPELSELIQNLCRDKKTFKEDVRVNVQKRVQDICNDRDTYIKDVRKICEDKRAIKERIVNDCEDHDEEIDEEQFKKDYQEVVKRHKRVVNILGIWTHNWYESMTPRVGILRLTIAARLHMRLVPDSPKAEMQALIDDLQELALKYFLKLE